MSGWLRRGQSLFALAGILLLAGKGVILVSSELPELLQCCDRILVLSEGRATAMYGAAEATQEAIMAAATGHVVTGGPA